jgi:hypothetical protein
VFYLKNNTEHEGLFSQFTGMLSSLPEQAVELKRLNKKMPKGMRIPDSWFNDLDTTSCEAQKPDRLEFFFVVPSTNLADIINYQIKLLKLTQPNVYLPCDFKTAADTAYLDETADAGIFTKVGIHRLVINITAYFDYTKRKSVDCVRKMAKEDAVLLAGLPSLGALALQHPEFIQLDSHKPPYELHVDVADVVFPNNKALHIHWSKDDQALHIKLCKAKVFDRHYVRPAYVKTLES